MWTSGANPLHSQNGRDWDALIEAVGPASLLVVIDSRMGEALRRAHSAEDILQDAMLHAWRDRKSCEWRGLRSFRSWLLSIIDNRIREAADRLSAAKRGGGREAVPAIPGMPLGASESAWGPVDSSTPSRIAMFREHAQAIRAALLQLPDDLRDVVRLRLFDQLALEEIATRLGIGESAVRHRFRKGAELYERQLRVMLASQTRVAATNAAVSIGKSSPSV